MTDEQDRAIRHWMNRWIATGESGVTNEKKFLVLAAIARECFPTVDGLKDSEDAFVAGVSFGVLLECARLTNDFERMVTDVILGATRKGEGN